MRLSLLFLFLFSLTGCAQLQTVLTPGEYPFQVTTKAASEDYYLTLMADRKFLTPTNNTVRMKVRLENNAMRPMLLTFNSGKRFDVALRDMNGRLIGKWSDDRMFTFALENKTLHPGEEIEQEITMKVPPGQRDQVPDGRYQLVAELAERDYGFTTDPIVITYSD